MRWFRKKQPVEVGSLDRAAGRSDRAHLEEFARTRIGVEAYVEPRTAVTTATVVLVAHDGEWTRRRVPNERAAHELAQRLGIPSYDAQRVGYPRRMREWNRQRGSDGTTPGAAE